MLHVHTYMSIALISVFVNIRTLSPTNTGRTMENSWRKRNGKQGKSSISIEPLEYDRDGEKFVAPQSVPSLRRRKCSSNEVQAASLTSMTKRLVGRSSHDLIRSQGCTDTLLNLVLLLCEYNNCHDSEEGPRIPSRPHECVSRTNGSGRPQGTYASLKRCMYIVGVN